MKAEGKTDFAKEPAKAIERAIARFVEKSVSNRRKVDGGKYFDTPLVGYASANDPLFKHYKKLIGKFHLSPREMFELTYGKGDDNSGLSVISWVLPVSEDTRKGNRRQDRFPCQLWSHTRFFGEPFNEELRNHVVSLLKKKGYRAVAPANSPHFIHHTHKPKVGFTSNYSERHAAYVCGLGTFGLCDGFITPIGKAMRLGSVVTDLVLTPSERAYPDHHANCLYYFNGTCKACASRCPAGAITAEGHDKDKCFDYMHNVSSPASAAEYGVKITGCGLCQTKVPCEFEIPKPIRKQRERDRQTSGGV